MKSAILIDRVTVLPMTATGDRTKTFAGAVGIEDNLIRLVTTDRAEVDRFRQTHPGLREIDGRGRLLMPGLINTHGHVAMTLQRSFADDISLMSWLNDYIWPFEARQTPEEIELGAELGMAEMLLGGTTSFVDMYWSEPHVARAARRRGIRAVLGVSYLDTNMEAFDADFSALLREVEDCDRIRAAVAPHSGYSCSPENLQYGKELARKHGLLYTTHIAETRDEVEIIRQRYGKTPVSHLASLGVLDDRTIGAHCVWVDDRDIGLLREKGVFVSHNPQSNMKISSGVAPVEKMMRAGVRCTVGTDGACSNNDLDMWEEIRTASFLQKSATENPCALPAYDVLRMATVEAAAAIGYGGRLGVVREGAIADLILLDLQRPHLVPVHDLVSNLVYCGKASDVDTVIVDGRILVEQRRIADLDMAELFDRVQAAADAIKRR